MQPKRLRRGRAVVDCSGHPARDTPITEDQVNGMTPRTGMRHGASIWRGALVIIGAALLFFSASARPTDAQAPEIPEGPIDPNNGEQTLLDLVWGIPINDIQNALNNFPVPYIVVASADGSEPVVVSNRAGSPTRVDADRTKATGKGNSGHDLIVEVNTALLPTPSLQLDIERLGNAPFAEDLQVVVVFPFTAFNDEDAIPGGDAPNLFFGYESTAAFDDVAETYPAGGHAPELVSYTITPGTLTGTSHVFDMDIATEGADNPVRFIAGHFNAPPGAAAPEDAIGMTLLTDPVPELISMSIDTNASAIAVGGTTMAQFGVEWEASEATKVIFDYIENEDFPIPVPPDYGTSITFDQMPTEQAIDLGVDFANQVITLDLAGNAPIGTMTVDHRRADDLVVEVVATDVPTEVGMTLDFAGSLEILVNDNTMDVAMTATQMGDDGFPGSSGLFGYPLRFFYIGATNVPDTTASWNTTTQTYSVGAVNGGESIGSVSFVIDDDAASIDDAANLSLPPDQSGLGTGVNIPWDENGRHIFSVADDGLHGTAAVRLVDVVEASVNFAAATLEDISNAYTLETAAAHPLTTYLRLHPESTLTDEDIEATCNVHDFPGGITELGFELPPPTVKFSFENLSDPPQGIDELSCFGFVNTTNFDVLAGDLPPLWGFEFDPTGSLAVVAEDGLGGPDAIGTLGVRLWDSDGENGLGIATATVLGEVLRDARFRVDSVPSFNATWSDAATSTTIDFDTVAASGPYAYLGGAQVGISTTIAFESQFDAASAGADHYLTFRDLGNDAAGEPLQKMLQAGAFGIDSFNYTSTESSGARTLAATYAADENHRLVVDLETAFDGRFFPDFAIDAQLIVDAVPKDWSFSTDLATSFVSNASADEIDVITVQGTVHSKLATGGGAGVIYGPDSVDDSAQAYAENALAGAIAIAGEQSAAVSANTATQATLAAPWPNGAPAAGSPYIIASPVIIDAAILGLPTQATFSLDPSIEGGASLALNNALDSIYVDLRSSHSIFGSEYRHIVVDIEEIPATITADWGLLPNPHANLSTSSPLGPVSVVLSRDAADSTDAKYDVFEVPLGDVNYSAFTREIDRRYVRLGQGNADAREAALLGRLDATYGTTAQLDPAEDHLIMLEGDDGETSFISIRGTGFQCVSAQVGPGSLQCDPRPVNPGEINASIAIPTAGAHPFFVGLQDSADEFTVIQIPDIPDTTSVIVGLSRAHLDFSGSAGDILIYQGPLPGAGDGDDVLKLLLLDTPSFVHVNWDLGFPGGINVDTSNPLEVRLLTQDGSNRTLAAFQVGDLAATWGIDAVTTDEKCQIDPPGCGLYLQFAKVFFDFDANPGLDGYVFTYIADGSPSALSPAGPAPGAVEYVPRVSFLMDGFSTFDASLQLEICYVGLCVVGALLPNADINTDLLGSFNVDFWDMGGGPLNILGDKDYIDNDPWDLWPLLHAQANHEFPFGP